MDRRRFAPATEPLDGRILLTTTGLNLVSLAAAVNLEKTATIAGLDAVLDSESPGRVVPENLVAPLRADLTAVLGTLSQPGAPRPHGP